jgi:hypothetical protein
MTGQEPEAELIGDVPGVDGQVYRFEGVLYGAVAAPVPAGTAIAMAGCPWLRGTDGVIVSIWRLDDTLERGSEPVWHRYLVPRGTENTAKEIARKARGLRTNRLRFADSVITLITVDDGRPLDVLEVAFLHTMAMMLREVERNPTSVTDFRSQADGAEMIAVFDLLDGEPSIDGFDLPSNWQRWPSSLVRVTRVDDGVPAELRYAVGGPIQMGSRVRIEHVGDHEYLARRI